MCFSVFILFNIDESLVVGCYSTLETAKKNGQLNLGWCINWCVIESKLDNNPVKTINNVYQNDIDNF